MTMVTAGRLVEDAQEFLRFKRAMGIPYRRGEFVLDSFVRFVAQRWGNDGEVELRDAIARWCARTAGRKAVTLGNEFGVVRQLCLFRRRHYPMSYVPQHALAPVKESTFLPARMMCGGSWLWLLPTGAGSIGLPCCVHSSWCFIARG